MTKPVCTLVCGLPGSGKTTVAKTIPGLRLNLDDIRRMMGYTYCAREKWTKPMEDSAIETMLAGVEGAVNNGQDVVLDNTFLHSRLPSRVRRRVGGRATFKVIRMDTDVEECIRRDSLRPATQRVGEAVIRKMAKNSKWKLTEEYMNVWPDVEPYEERLDLPDCILVDLDGTLADISWRDPYNATLCEGDGVNAAVQSVLHNFPGVVVFLSGRNSEFRSKTLSWLEKKVEFPDTWELHMRNEDDKRPDFNVKYDLFNEHIRGKYNVLFAMDDRDQVVRLWREMNIPCHQVRYGDF